MRLLCCGSRSWVDKEVVRDILIELKPALVIDGGARGADSIAHAIAIEMGIPTKRYLADWHRNGRAAGPIRNQWMLDEGQPNLVVAFWDGVSRGTADMIQRAKRAKVSVRIVYSPERSLSMTGEPGG